MLLVSTFARLATHPLGFKADHLLVAELAAKPSPEGQEGWLSAAADVRALPGVELGRPRRMGSAQGKPVALGRSRRRHAAAGSGVLPRRLARLLRDDADPAGRRPGSAGRRRQADIDARSRPHDGVGVVNQAFVRAYFGGRSPIGERVTVQVRRRCAPPVEIVGVVGDTVYAALRDPLRPTVYVPVRQDGRVSLIVRTAGDPEAFAPCCAARWPAPARRAESG